MNNSIFNHSEKMKPPYEYTLREYQQDAVNGFWNFVRKSEGNPVLILPTAAGKSVIIADICKGLVAVGYRGLVICRQKELVQQNLAALNRFCPDVDAGIYCAGLVGNKQTKTSSLGPFSHCRGMRTPLGPDN